MTPGIVGQLHPARGAFRLPGAGRFRARPGRLSRRRFRPGPRRLRERVLEVPLPERRPLPVKRQHVHRAALLLVPPHPVRHAQPLEVVRPLDRDRLRGLGPDRPAARAPAAPVRAGRILAAHPARRLQEVELAAGPVADAEIDLPQVQRPALVGLQPRVLLRAVFLLQHVADGGLGDDPENRPLEHHAVLVAERLRLRGAARQGGRGRPGGQRYACHERSSRARGAPARRARCSIPARHGVLSDGRGACAVAPDVESLSISMKQRENLSN